jgi:hypothetical protein
VFFSWVDESPMTRSRGRADIQWLMKRDSSEASSVSMQVVKALCPSLTTWRGPLAHLARTLPIHTVGRRPTRSVWVDRVGLASVHVHADSGIHRLIHCSERCVGVVVASPKESVLTMAL